MIQPPTQMKPQRAETVGELIEAMKGLPHDMKLRSEQDGEFHGVFATVEDGFLVFTISGLESDDDEEDLED